MYSSAALFKLALFTCIIGVGMAGLAHASSIPVKAKIKARVEARLSELKGCELTGRKTSVEWCQECPTCGPNCNACCCCYGGCPEGSYDCGTALSLGTFKSV